MQVPLARLKRSVAHAATQSLFYGAETLGLMSLGEDFSPGTLRIHKNISYAPHPAAHLDVIRPAGEGPFPVVFHVHGGGFTVLSKETHQGVAEAYARRGYLVVNVDYRLAPEHTFPAAPEDVADAYQWMVRHVGEFGGDLDRLVLAGDSAGANLILGLAIGATFTRPEPFAERVFETGVVPSAIVPASGLLQVSNPERVRARGPLGLIARREVQRIHREYLPPEGPVELADPLLILEAGLSPVRRFPATFVLWGGGDPIGPDSRRLVDALKRRRIEVEGTSYGREPHSFHVFLWREHAQKAWRDTFAFLDRHLETAPLRRAA